MNLLLIETATTVCSVALATPSGIVARRESHTPNAHSTSLHLFIDQLLKERRLQPRDLHAVCVSAGPGSYTGLRIGVSTAKGFCYALGIPLLSVPTLLSMAALYYLRHPDYRGHVCPMIDARRMECYTMIVGPGMEILRNTSADIIDTGLYDHYLDSAEVVFIGDGAPKTRHLLGIHPNACFDDTLLPSAEGLLPSALEKFAAGNVEDVAYFQPLYLKDFVAKKSVVHGLR